MNTSFHLPRLLLPASLVLTSDCRESVFSDGHLSVMDGDGALLVQRLTGAHRLGRLMGRGVRGFACGKGFLDAVGIELSGRERLTKSKDSFFSFDFVT